jgi:nitrogen fixation/metabolism regulation signal transduction histidine kinase
MRQIEVAVFAFDDQHHLRLVNRAGERLLGKPAEQLLDRTAEDLNLSMCLEGEAPRTLDISFAGTMSRWEMQRSTFRQGGLPHQLIVLSDLSRALREEERLMWQRLIRVLGHELNNSLAPIKSIAGSLEKLIQSELPADCQDDIRRGLSVIASRAEALSKFMGAYAKLARLPQPQLQTMDVKQWITRVISLETRIPIQISVGPQLFIQADPGQLEQLLINLLRNAVDAAMETGGGVKVGWLRSEHYLEVWIEDEGPGIASTSNLFVPFFTTKTGGTGIGLVLSRQIAEAHGGTVAVTNRPEGKGCMARLRLPLQTVAIPSPVAI